MKENEHRKTNDTSYGNIKLSPFGRFFRFIGWWFGFTGLHAMFSVCPFCGQQGCPAGLVSAGTVGAFISLCLQDWKRLFAFIKTKIPAESLNSCEIKDYASIVDLGSCKRCQ